MVERTKYRMTFKCSCGNIFRKITTDPDLMAPPCPKCKQSHKKTKFVRTGDGPISDSDLFAEKVARKLRETPEWQQQYMAKALAPTTVESRNLNKCVDKTADIVMHDYKMTNLKDNVRPGETMAPKLAPNLQSAADGMFGGGSSQKKRLGIDTARIARAAMSGSLRDPRSYVDPVAALHKAESRGRA